MFIIILKISVFIRKNIIRLLRYSENILKYPIRGQPIGTLKIKVPSGGPLIGYLRLI